jgi:drug/metabolite transporter (DMT)-like permease
VSARNIKASTFWMLGAILAFSLTAVAGREATTVLETSGLEKSLSISQLVFFRNVIGLAVILLLLSFHYLRGGNLTLRSQHLKLHIGRNFTHFCGQWCWFYGLAILPLAQVFAIEFTVPIWTAIFAGILLKEKLTPARIIALAFGFSGVLLILKPGYSVVEWASWVVLFSAIAYALTHTLTKRISGHDSALTILLYMHLIQLPLALLLVVFDFAWPQGIVWLYVVLTAVAAMSAHYCMAKALSYSDAMVVMPMDFLRLPLIALVGYLFYQEQIDLWLFAGALMMLLGNMLSLKESAKITDS